MFFEKKPSSAADRRLEDELLLCCARLKLNEENASRIRALVRKGPAWDYLFWSASRHGLTPLLYRHLIATCQETIPAVAMERLGVLVRENAAWSMLLTGELLKVLSILESQGIRAIPFKGPVLAAFVYGSVTMRQYKDLDLLVHPDDFSRAKELLVFYGYHPIDPISSAPEFAFLQSQCHHYALRNKTGNVMIELHWQILPSYYPFRLDFDRLWKTQEPRELGGRRLPNLSPEDLLLICCVHGSMHTWERLAWLCDVAAVLNTHPGLEWERVITMAAGLRVARVFFLGLFLANELLGAPLPENIRQRIKGDPVIEILAKKVRLELFREPGNLSRVFKEIIFDLKAMDYLRDKVRYCTKRTFTPSMIDWAKIPLPSDYFPLWYLIMPWRFFVKCISRLKAQNK